MIVIKHYKIRKIFFKYIVILFFIFLIIKITLFLKIIKSKVCLCTIGKNENLYVKEFVEHYKSYGIDKIFIYDNNDIEGEIFDNVIPEYIKNHFVEIINYRGKNKAQLVAMNDCYKNNYKNYNWLLFYDMDEFIFLKNFKNIKLFLNKKRLNNCQIIQLNWVQHTDNNLLYYDNRSLSQRFIERGKKIEGLIDIKSIIRGNISTNIIDAHYINPNLKCCDGYGKKKIIINKMFDLFPDYNNYFIDHYYSKSTQEFINKINRGSVAYGNEKRVQIINFYFKLNDITSQKIDYFEKEIKVNLSSFRNRSNINL